MTLAERIARLTPEQLADPAIRAAAQDYLLASRRVLKTQRARPLAFGRLWHRDPPRTSQRTAMQRICSTDCHIGFIRGGNRTGKSTCGAMWAIAMACGRDHRDVKRWIEQNDLDPSYFPEGPGAVWAVALTFPDSRRYVRKKIREYAESGARYRNWNAENEAEIRFPGGGLIVCKAVKQGRAGFQGDAVRAIWFDEEPSDEGVWDEAQMRLADENGRTLLSATPLLGRSWLMKKLVLERDLPGIIDQQLDGLDNPHVPSDVLARIYAGYGKFQRAARRKGEIVILEGRVLPSFSRYSHVYPERREIPAEWPRYISIDPGTRNPCGIIIAAHDEDNDRLYVLGSWKQAQTRYVQRAAAIRGLERVYGRAEVYLCDPEDRGFRLELSSEHGIDTVPSPKTFQPTISAVSSRLAIPIVGSAGETEPPGLLISDRCRDLIDEMESYRWAEGGERPKKVDDHLVDCLRYLCLWLQRQGEMGAS